MATRRRGAAIAAGALVLAVVICLMVWLVLRDGPAPAPAPVATPQVTVTPPSPSTEPEPEPRCARSARTGFVPTGISVEGVVRRTAVVGLPRDAAGVPGVPPVNDKQVFAWDLGGVEPGSDAGQVLLNTHTWPDGSAMGNALLGAFDVGDELVLRGDDGSFACYEVTERVEVRAEDGYPGYGATDGPPRVVIVVCSGDRLGPGQWTHRTLWFAEPVEQEPNPAPPS